MLRHIALLLVIAPISSPALAAACPADGASELGRTRIELLELAAFAASQADARCATKGRALADFVQVGPLEGSCSALARIEAVEGAQEDADLLAFSAWLAWRCGQPRAAHRLALGALGANESATAAWTLLGRILASRFMEEPARMAFRRALDVDPHETEALLGLASVVGDREERKALLRRFVEASSARGEKRERVRSALENLEFVEALGDREIFRLEKAELPGAIELEALVTGPGRIAGWTIPLAFREGKVVDALFDSGASGLYLAPRAAEAAHIEPLSEGTLVGGGGEGEHEIERGIVPALDLGPLVFADALAVQAAGELHQRGRYLAIVGVDLFGGTRLVFDPRGRRVDVFSTIEPEGRSGPLEADPWPSGSERIPIMRVSGMLLVQARVRVRDEVVPVLMLLDTGASRTYLADSSASLLSNRRVGTGRDARGFGGTIRARGEVPAAEIELGRAAHGLRGIPVFSLASRSSLVGVPVGGFLGVDWLARQPFTIDLREGWVEIRERRSRRRR